MSFFRWTSNNWFTPLVTLVRDHHKNREPNLVPYIGPPFSYSFTGWHDFSCLSLHQCLVKSTPWKQTFYICSICSSTTIKNCKIPGGIEVANTCNLPTYNTTFPSPTQTGKLTTRRYRTLLNRKTPYLYYGGRRYCSSYRRNSQPLFNREKRTER